MAGTFTNGETLPDGARIDCNACGESLYHLPDVHPLAFHCTNGHFFTLGDLLDELLSSGRSPVAVTLERWQRNTHLLRWMAGRALASGHVLKAADFLEAANRIDQWSSKLTLLFPAPGPRSARAG